MRIFKEEQRFTQWWLWLLLSCIMLIPVYGIIKQLIFKKSFGDSPMSTNGLIIFTIGMILFLVFFLFLRLKTRIDETGVHFQFFPFHFSARTIAWSELTTAKTKKYRPILDYGGWGIKHGSYTVKGNIGLQLALKNGKKILIGTQKLQEVNSVLKSYENKIPTNEI